MISLNVIVDPNGANEFLEKHGLQEDPALLEAVLLQGNGMESGLPAVLLVATIDGKKRVIKTSLRALLAASGGLNAATERVLGPNWRGP